MWTIVLILVALLAFGPLVAKSISNLLHVLIVLALALALTAIRPARRLR